MLLLKSPAVVVPLMMSSRLSLPALLRIDAEAHERPCVAMGGGISGEEASSREWRR